MKLIFDDKTILLCENKLDAIETLGNEHTDYLQQLERYLRLDVDGVMYIRTSLKPPSPSVLKHPKYLKPEDKSHFLWRDFYDLLIGDSNPLVQELKSGFEYMGFVPPNPTIGDLSRQAPREQRGGQRRLKRNKVAGKLALVTLLNGILSMRMQI